MRRDVGGGCQRARVRADGSGVNSGRVDGVRHSALHGEAVEQNGRREGALCRGHVRSGFRTEWCYGFAPGIPAGAERGKPRLRSCSCVSRPPVSELLVPAFGVPGAADTDVRPPDGRMSMCSHNHLLGFVRAVRSTNRLMTNIG
jgi:hypothetical protein